jgi:hypothetical protein
MPILHAIFDPPVEKKTMEEILKEELVGVEHPLARLSAESRAKSKYRDQFVKQLKTFDVPIVSYDDNKSNIEKSVGFIKWL